MKPFPKPIYVTKPFLPPLKEFTDGCREIWDNRWLTNCGPLVQRYKKELSRYLGTNNLCIFNNGTLALQIALQGLDLTGEVITTPFSFVATTHALYWNNLRPVFSDIDPEYFNLNPDKIEEKITPLTTAILAVHVFGNPCVHDKLQKIAQKHNLKLIYDAAHAFGVKTKGSNISDLGDISMFSFHATKVYHSFEGGMLTFTDPSLKKKFNYLKNFGFENEIEVIMPGTNAKMSEIHALMGQLMLKYMPQIICERRKIDAIYREGLGKVKGIVFQRPPADTEINYSYMPILVKSDEFGITRDELYEKLKEYNIYSRRYFYPLISDFPCYKSIQTIEDPLVVAKYVASEVLTLPIYNGLSESDVNKICDIIIHIQKGSKKI